MWIILITLVIVLAVTVSRRATSLYTSARNAVISTVTAILKNSGCEHGKERVQWAIK